MGKHSFHSRLVCDLKPGFITEAENVLHLSVEFRIVLFPVFLLAEVSCISLCSQETQKYCWVLCRLPESEHGIRRCKTIKLPVKCATMDSKKAHKALR